MRKYSHISNPYNAEIIDVGLLTIFTITDDNKKYLACDLDEIVADLIKKGNKKNYKIAIESFQKERTFRIKCGTLSKVINPKKEYLKDFDISDPISFRLIVTKPNTSELAAYNTKKIKVIDNENWNENILISDFAKINQVWKLHLSPNEEPKLILSKELEHSDFINDLGKNDWPAGVVTIPAFRNAIMHLMRYPNDLDDPNSWQAKYNRWLKYHLNFDFIDFIDGVEKDLGRKMYSNLDSWEERIMEKTDELFEIFVKDKGYIQMIINFIKNK
jgi:hypothetical protein